MKVAIIDLDSVCFSIGIGNKVLDSKGEPIRENDKFVYIDKTDDELRNSCHYWMNHILSKSESTHYIALIKGKGNYRYTVNKNYKASRPTESPKWWKLVKEYLVSEFKAVEVNGIEVDDAVNIVRLSVPDSFICAIDKDLLGLEGTHYNWRKEEWVTNNKNEAIEYFWKSMVCGDKVDDIKGIPGKGEKAFEKIKAGYFWDITANKYYRTEVLNAYIEHFGEYIGIEEFYKNYMCLSILDRYEGFIIPELISVK